MSGKTDWREPYDPEFEEWVWELRAERRDYPNLRPDLQPLDSDDEPSQRHSRRQAEAASPIKEREQS